MSLALTKLAKLQIFRRAFAFFASTDGKPKHSRRSIHLQSDFAVGVDCRKTFGLARPVTTTRVSNKDRSPVTIHT
jgi:hypothetical protein